MHELLHCKCYLKLAALINVDKEMKAIYPESQLSLCIIKCAVKCEHVSYTLYILAMFLHRQIFIPVTTVLKQYLSK